MDSIPLGATGETVSPLCLGTMYFGSKTDADTPYRLLDRYYEVGGRFLDTVNTYATSVNGFDKPASEPLLGEWMDERGNREELFIVMSVGFGSGEYPSRSIPS
jgi:aryl-alcohol dehydrogenase-like predicted oxidoreductase